MRDTKSRVTRGPTAGRDWLGPRQDLPSISRKVCELSRNPALVRLSRHAQGDGIGLATYRAAVSPRPRDRSLSAPNSLAVGGLFAGIGGIEQGFARAGHRAAFLCERDEHAARVLAARFPEVQVHPDVRELVAIADSLPHIDVLVGGFPCQDLSQAGLTQGIRGERSGLVSHMLDLMERLDRRANPARWLVFENVSNMLRLDGGAAMDYLTNKLVELGYAWAYRLVDTLGFGIPQRRHRVLMVASKYEDPRRVLFTQDAGRPPSTGEGRSIGFYWTEGLRGLGWAEDAVPTLKGGSGLGIPSPPAVWTPEFAREDAPEFGTIVLEDAERLQGFEAGWTDVPLADGRPMPIGARWRMVGNAVTVDVAAWLGERLAQPADPVCRAFPRVAFARWPDAAYGSEEGLYEVVASKWPVNRPLEPLVDFLRYGLAPLSLKAAVGFRERTMRARLDFSFRQDFLDALDVYILERGGDVQSVRELSRQRQHAAEHRRAQKIQVA